MQDNKKPKFRDEETIVTKEEVRNQAFNLAEQLRMNGGE